LDQNDPNYNKIWEIFSATETNDVNDVKNPGIFYPIDTKTDQKYYVLYSGLGWGWCEAIAMEKIRHLKAVWINEGLFGHYDNWVKLLK